MGTVITFITDTVTVTLTGDRPDLGPVYEKLDGWYGIDDVDLRFAPRPSAPGAYAPTQTFPGEAVISVEGKYFGADRASALAMRETLAELYNEGRPVRMIVADDLRTTEREVHVARVGIPWKIHPDFEYTIDAKAADPRRYGAPVVLSTPLAAPGSGLALPSNEATGVGLALPSNEAPTPDLGLDFGTIGVDGRVTFVNAGNADTASIFTADGAAGSMPDGFDIVNVDTGQRITYAGPLSLGTTVTIDTRLRSAFVNNAAPAGRYLVNPEWWTTPRKKSTTMQFVARGVVTGSPMLYVETAPAFY